MWNKQGLKFKTKTPPYQSNGKARAERLTLLRPFYYPFISRFNFFVKRMRAGE